jgi:putative membrane protein
MTSPDKPAVASSPEPEAASTDFVVGARHGLVATMSKAVERVHAKVGSWGTFTAPPSVEKSPTDLAQYRTSLAVHRTLMGADRSLMAWIRTALSMVSFGFTIYKILQNFAEQGGALGAAGQPRVVALFLIGVGNASILLGIIEYWQRAKDLSAYEDIPIWRASFVMAVVIALLSVSLLVAVTFKAL